MSSIIKLIAPTRLLQFIAAAFFLITISSTNANDLPLIMPDANLVVKIDINRIRSSPLYDLLLLLQKLKKDATSVVQEHTGDIERNQNLGENADIGAIFLFVRLKHPLSVATGLIPPPALNDAPLVLVVDLLEACSWDELSAAVGRLNNIHNNLKVEVVADSKVPAMQITVAGLTGNTQILTLNITLVDNGRRVIAGTATGLRIAREQLQPNAKVSFSDEMQKALGTLPPNIDGLLVLTPSKEDEKLITGMSEKNKDRPHNYYYSIMDTHSIFMCFKTTHIALDLACQINAHSKVYINEIEKHALLLSGLLGMGMELFFNPASTTANSMDFTKSLKVRASGNSVRISGRLTKVDLGLIGNWFVRQITLETVAP